MTKFEQAVLQVESGTLQAPSVNYEGKKVDYFGYQLAVHHFNLKLMSKGIQSRGIKLKDLKAYYGLKGRTAVDCLPQYEALMERYKNRTLLN
jgi:hypothetical protein